MVGVFGSDHEIMMEPAELALPEGVELVGEVVDFLPALVRAQRDRCGAWCLRIIGVARTAARAGQHVAVLGVAAAHRVFDAPVAEFGDARRDQQRCS